MEQQPDHKLLFLPSGNDDDFGCIINLALVRMIDEIRDGHCRIVFDPGHMVMLEGAASNEFLRVMGRRATLLTGDSLATALDIVTSESPETEQPEA